MAGRWSDTVPEQAVNWLRNATVPWWICGGWAIELWIGRPVRPHSDLEIGCFRDDLRAVLESFPNWEIAVARQKVLTVFDPTAPLPQPPFSLWLRRAGGELWDLEVLVEERRGDRWVYRRDQRISLPAAELAITGAQAVPFIAPEVQLLYKSKAPRAKDEADFDAALPMLKTGRREWLREALFRTASGASWLARL